MKTTLKPGYKALAVLLQEAGLFHSDVQARLCDTIRDMTLDSGSYCYYVTHDGDGSTGSVIYSCDGGLCKAPYTISETGSTSSCVIDMDQAIDVVPTVTYKTEATETTEAKRASVTGTIQLKESVAFPADVTLAEAFKPSYQIKLIAPGPGSSAFYPAEVLKRDGPKVFRAGTPMRIDHPTRAEEAARPEGSVKDWGAVLAKDAYWLEDHPKGPGLYSEVKPFSDHVQTIDEKGAYAGVSIRANGDALMEAGKPVMKNGLPVLARFTSAEGVDMVTRAGAGGMFLSESARAANQQEVTMTEQEVKALVESAVKIAVTEAVAAVTKPVSALEQRAIRGDATVEAHRILTGITLPEASKGRVVENVLRDLPLKEGALDIAKFGDLVTAEAKREGSYVASLTGSGRVLGMGGAPVESDPVKLAESRKRSAEEATDLYESDVRTFMANGMPEAAAKIAAQSMREAA